MEEKKKACVGHVLLVPYPSQGHVNPLLQLGKRLASKGLKVTVAVTNFIFKTMNPKSDTVAFATISDGCDQGGFSEVNSVGTYLERLESAGSKTLAEVIIKKKEEEEEEGFDCIVYDAFLPWALDVGKQCGVLFGGAFFTQACAVNYIYYLAHHGLLSDNLPLSSSEGFNIPGFSSLLHLEDMPSFIYVHGSYPDYFRMVLNQFSNVDKADFVLINSFYKLEDEVVEQMSKISKLRLLTVGPTIPSSYLDKRIKNDDDYNLHLFHMDQSYSAKWLNNKPIGSVVYISFGSMASLTKEQMEEVAWGLQRSNSYFLWVCRSSDEEAKLPKDFLLSVAAAPSSSSASSEDSNNNNSSKGVFVRWSPQLEILSNEAIGCFFSHGGWNSTIEALSLGVPMVVMPQWTDQTTNAKLVQDVWRVGVRARGSDDDESGLVKRNEIERCIREVVTGEIGKEMKRNALKWKELAREAVSEGGTSDENIEALVAICSQKNKLEES